MRAALLLFAACGGAAATPDARAPDAGAPDAPFVCDPLAQDCGGGDKCAYTSDGGPDVRSCVPPTGSGTIAVDQPCTRDPAGLGHDDCAAGLFCTFIDVLPPSSGGTRYCRAMCGADTDCPPAQRCADIVDGPRQGFCGPTCAPFAGTCTDGMTCADLWSDTSGDFDVFLACRVAGAVANGGACTSNYDCGADAVCLIGVPGLAQVCRALCDDQHPCATQCYRPGGGSVGVCTD